VKRAAEVICKQERNDNNCWLNNIEKASRKVV
jgi:hypothetical protein